MRRTRATGLAFDTSLYNYPGEKLQAQWGALHKGDKEPFPTEQRIARLSKGDTTLSKQVASAGGASVVAEALRAAWRAFHAGDFTRAIDIGGKQGELGAAAANKAAAILSLYLEKDERRRLAILREAIDRGEAAARHLPDSPNVHYSLALVLGRYSQRISIVEAVAAGHASRIRELLEHTLELEPKHAEAHVALGLFHAELVKTLGSLAASLTFGASRAAAIDHFRQAVKLIPTSAIAHVEYAHGLLLLDAEAHQQEVAKLCSKASAFKPRDAMEHFDVERAKHSCTHA